MAQEDLRISPLIPKKERRILAAITTSLVETACQLHRVRAAFFSDLEYLTFALIMATDRVNAAPLNRVWENKYTERRDDRLHMAEDPRVDSSLGMFPSDIILPTYLETDNITGLAMAFLKARRDCLEAPSELSDAALRAFLTAARSEDLKPLTRGLHPPNCTILLDDRRDPGLGTWAVRRWDGPEAYTEYPPEGCDIWPPVQKNLSLAELTVRLKESVCHSSIHIILYSLTSPQRHEKKAEKRTM
jgi:hypothetical protein